MPKYEVVIPLKMVLEVEAENEQAARDDAAEWVRWVDPTDEQFDDFKEDRVTGVLGSGDLDFNGKLEVEELLDD